MSSPDTIDKLARLLQDVGQAHHRAFIETDGYDPEWPLWYAEYMQRKLNTALKSNFTISELVYHLQLVTNNYEQDDSTQSWWEYAAIYFWKLANEQADI